MLDDIVSARKSLCLYIPPCLCFAPDTNEGSSELAGRDHTVRLRGAGLPVGAAAGRERRVLLALSPFFGDIHHEGTGCSRPALHW